MAPGKGTSGAGSHKHDFTARGALTVILQHSLRGPSVFFVFCAHSAPGWAPASDVGIVKVTPSLQDRRRRDVPLACCLPDRHWSCISAATARHHVVGLSRRALDQVASKLHRLAALPGLWDEVCLSTSLDSGASSL